MKKTLKLFYCLLLLCMGALPLSAQDFIDEDLLDNIELNARGLWNENTAAFTTNTIPSKYNDESAVIIGFRRSITIDKVSRAGFFRKGEKSLYFFENVRFKIKLLDKSAVDRYTEIYFRYNDKQDGFSAHVIKQDGTVMPASLNEAVGVESEAGMPEFFKSYFDQESGAQQRYFKVAIPDLGPGDILEYVTNTKSKLNVASSGYIQFSPQYEVCSKPFPILFNQIVIETDDKSFFKSMSFNGAPEFKKEAGSDPEFHRYVFTDAERGTEKDINFVNPFQVYPVAKFQVIYANNAEAKGALIGSKGELKTGFSKEELAKKAWEDYAMMGKAPYNVHGATVQMLINSLWVDLKKLGAKDWTEKQYIDKVYYRVRNLVVYRDTYLNDKLFAYIFGSLLYMREIKSEVVISISNRIGSLRDVLFDEEIKYAIKVGNNFYFNCTDHTNPGELLESMLGNEAYIIAEPEKKGGQQITPLKLPDAGPAQNTADYIINAALDKDMSTLSVSRTSGFKGISKAKKIDAALKFIPYMLDDYKYFGGSSPADEMRAAQQDEYYKSMKAIKDELKEAKPEFVKSELQQEYGGPVKYRGFDLSSDGRSVKKMDLVYKEDFDVNGMIRKAGKKYLVNIAGLVGGQLQIKKEERNRKYDMNVGFARTQSWTINFKIPEGYTVDGLKELSVHVNNDAGAYESAAEEINGMVVLTIKKQYKAANIAKDKWTDMLAVVDAAYNNSYKYILLKPKG